jgi:hypothetical protein
MSKFFNGINAFLKADWWTGGSWLIVLCVIHAVTILFYVLIHLGSPGNEFTQLEPDQVKTINSLLANYPDNQIPTGVNDSTSKRHYIDSIDRTRLQRTHAVKQFLRTELQCQLDTCQVQELDSTMKELTTKDAGVYLTEKKFQVRSFFWLSGKRLYWEALLWSFIGMITSLIYYVSLANQLALKKTADDDIGPFDTSEISAMVAKMFYAPIITLVLVLGYNYFSSKSGGTLNISVNHGLILFAFLAGFYSGRLMKLLDNLKNLILPVSSDGNTKKPGDTPTATTADITVQLKLADLVAKGPDGAGIEAAGFNTAIVTLALTDKSGKIITLNVPSDSQPSVFTGSKIPYGKYKATAKYVYDKKVPNIVLSASQDIEISESAAKAFVLILDIHKAQE